MTDNQWNHIENVDTLCFACGRDNAHGLQMIFESNGEKLRSTVTIPEHHRGWSNLVHGGILATLIGLAWIVYCLLLGKKPQSFYSVYRAWYKNCHGHDVEMATLPFLPPSQANFLYDPFAIDFENPFDVEDDPWSRVGGLDIQGSLQEKQSSMNFENFIKCLQIGWIRYCHKEAIAAFETKHRASQPWLFRDA